MVVMLDPIQDVVEADPVPITDYLITPQQLIIAQRRLEERVTALEKHEAAMAAELQKITKLAAQNAALRKLLIKVIRFLVLQCLLIQLYCEHFV